MGLVLNLVRLFGTVFTPVGGGPGKVVGLVHVHHAC